MAQRHEVEAWVNAEAWDNPIQARWVVDQIMGSGTDDEEAWIEVCEQSDRFEYDPAAAFSATLAAWVVAGDSVDMRRLPDGQIVLAVGASGEYVVGGAETNPAGATWFYATPYTEDGRVTSDTYVTDDRDQMVTYLTSWCDIQCRQEGSGD